MGTIHEFTRAPESDRRPAPKTTYAIVASHVGCFTVESAGGMIAVKKLVWAGTSNDTPPQALPIEVWDAIDLARHP